MLLPCPWCGHRNVSEFGYVGEKVSRPDPATTDATQWREYLYLRTNPRGWTVERWYHRAGCRRYVEVERDTVSNQVRQAATGGTPAAADRRPELGTE
ncbi:MAG: sarcosine oxidase subunit delta [Micromonosporaceae bacterium]